MSKKRPTRRKYPETTTRKKPVLPPGAAVPSYHEVARLRTFLTDRGKIRSRRITGLTPQQQRQVATAIKNAREMALLPYAGQ